MPSLRVSVDGTVVASVCTDGYDSLSARVSGTRIDEELATLDVAGGSYPNDAESTYLTWIDSTLNPGQVVLVEFIESEPSTHKGKTIEELAVGEPPVSKVDFKPNAEMFEQLRRTPRTRDKFSLRLGSSFGQSFVGETGPDDHGFSFSVHWTSFHPERARLSLHSYTLDGLENHKPMNNYVEERMNVGNSVHFQLDALYLPKEGP
jgi:hypothetical protein